MGKVITVISGKYRMGKTTTAVAISSCLAMLKYKTLCIDFDTDSQGIKNALGMTGNLNSKNVNIHEEQGGIIEACTEHPGIPGLFVVSMSALIEPDKYDVSIIKPVFNEIRQNFDYCVVDTPPMSYSGFSLAHADADMSIIVTTGEIPTMVDVLRSAQFAHDAGINEIRLLVNQIQPENSEQIKTAAGNVLDKIGAKLIGLIPYDEHIAETFFSKNPQIVHQKRVMTFRFLSVARGITGEIEEKHTTPDLPQDPQVPPLPQAQEPPPIPQAPIPMQQPAIPQPPSVSLSTGQKQQAPQSSSPFAPLPPPPPPPSELSLPSMPVPPKPPAMPPTFQEWLAANAGKYKTNNINPVSDEQNPDNNEPDIYDNEDDPFSDTSKLIGTYGDPNLWARSTLKDVDPDDIIAVHVVSQGPFLSREMVRNRMWLHDLLDDYNIPYYIEAGARDGSKDLVEAQHIFVEKKNAQMTMFLIKQFNESTSVINEDPDDEEPIISEDGVPQKKCPSCGENIDFDYHKCPHCKTKVE